MAKKIRVLILDDEENILNSLKREFYNEPFTVVTTTDADEAISIIEKEKIKVVVSDQRMPHITGVEFLGQVKEKFPDIVRILFTGYADINVAEDAVNVGKVYRFINKPWNSNALKTAIYQAMQHFDLVAEIRKLFKAMKVKKEELEILNRKFKAMYKVQQEFTSTVSHELRTPLAAIKSSIDILNTETPGKLTDEQKPFIKRVKSNVDRLSNLVNDILDLSKIESGKMRVHFLPQDINAIMQEIFEMYESVAKKKGLELKMQLGKKLPLLQLDKDRLIQVLNNLMSNALKFTKVGTISISTKYDEHKKNMEVSVRDTGSGIKKEDLEKLFNKFQQLGKASGQISGTGLGLAICKEIIKLHGGRIWAESEFGVGTSFYFVIPIKQKKRILIVDDDRTTVKILLSVLKSEDNYELVVAYDGFKAGQEYNNFKPHLIILDINIPYLNGLEVCSQIRNDPQKRDIKIIMISSFSKKEEEKRAFNAGADKILNKPINNNELTLIIKNLLEQESSIED